MDDDYKQMEDSIRGLALALPKGKHMQAIAIPAQVGFADVGAGTVCAIVIADSQEDLARAGQIIQKGVAASRETPGLVDHFVRTTRPQRPQD